MSDSHYYIEINKKSGLPDGRASALLESVKDLGIEGVERFIVGTLYIFSGELSEATLKKLCEELLCDRVAEDYLVKQGSLPSHRGTLSVEVTYHKGVTDAVAGTVTEALPALDIQGVDQVATGTVFHIFLDEDKEQQKSMDDIRTLCDRVLANTVIQNYEVYDSKGTQLFKG